MEQEKIKERKLQLQRRIRTSKNVIIRSAEELGLLEEICKNAIHKIKTKKWICPDCGKIHKRKKSRG